MRNTLANIAVGALLVSHPQHATAFTTTTSRSRSATLQGMPRPTTARLEMMQPSLDTSPEDVSNYNNPRSQRRRDRLQHPLRAVAVDTLSSTTTTSSISSTSGSATTTTNGEGTEDFFSQLQFLPSSSSVHTSSLLQVLSAAALVTGSTVGASMLVLPDLAAGPGLGLSTALFVGIYLLVLTSGLVIADVAIHQHESGDEVPSSFQEFARANLDDNSDGKMAQLISAIPIVVNSLVMVFDIGKAGELLGSSVLTGVDPFLGSMGFVAILGACLSTLSGTNLSAVASMCVSALLVAFGGLLLPGLTAVQDPIATLTAPGTVGDDWCPALVTAAPIVLTALQFQNVVPSLTKILQFDRTKTVVAIVLGSLTPLIMYVAWCYAVLGGGIVTSGVAGPLFSIFSASAVFGSAIGAGMSVTEEVETTLQSQVRAGVEGYTEGPEAVATTAKSEVFSLPAVLLSLTVPTVGVLAFSGGNDATVALGLAGSFGSPILYGVIPALMAWNQRQKTEVESKPLVPGGLASIGALGLAASVYVGEGLAQQVTGILS